MNDPGKFITLRQAASFIGISYQAVNQAVKRGTLEYRLIKILVSYKGTLREKFVKHTTVRWIYDFQENKRDVTRLKVYGKLIFDEEDGTYNVDKVCQILSMTKRQVYHLVSSGQIKAQRKGFYYVVFKEAVEKYMQERGLQCKSA
jgi:excisionase family DNA binding protein